MARKVFDCREFPGPCGLVMSGREEELMQAMVEHCVSSHGQQDGPELRDLIEAHLRDEAEWLRTAPAEAPVS